MLKNPMAKPLFMWAGGKTRMIPRYASRMPQDVRKYCEPFLGGGAMFLHCREQYNLSTVTLNDVNQELVGIYRAVRDDYQGFIQSLESLQEGYLVLDKAGRKEYYMQTRHANAYQSEQWGETQQAATLYFLMRTGFNGIFQTNKNTNGRFGTPAGLLNQRDRVYEPGVVRWWNQALQGVDLKHGSWEDAVKGLDPSTFFFLDPPYRGSFTSYGQTFGDVDQIRLVQWADTCPQVMLCNRETGDGFWDLHAGNLSCDKFDVTYTAGRRKQEPEGAFSAKKAQEVLLYRTI